MKENSFTEIFEKDVPLIDVRSELEFATGAFPSATNAPILNDDERHQVGLAYKHQGPAVAQELGFKLVSGLVKSRRLNVWISLLEKDPSTHIYCWRGGKRSEIASQWVKEAGYRAHRIPGGYKALRNFLLTEIESPPAFILIGGHTGSGKTELILDLKGGIDLEGLASHRGSAFGKRACPQPSQINFENSLAINFIKNRSEPIQILEDEGRLIGRIQIPPKIKAAMDDSPIIVLLEEKENRIERILNDYIISQYEELKNLHGEFAFDVFSNQLLNSTDAIRRRLGGQRHQEVRVMVEKALSDHSKGIIGSHRAWINFLLSEYYDPMYAFQMKNKSERITFSGTAAMIKDWLQDQYFTP